jgi:uncharacterized protein (TIGR02145 family)
MRRKHLLFIFCIISLGLTAQVPSYVPTNGLVGWWPFNGNANDESGNVNNGTVNGATLTTDRFGLANKAYSFDGVNDFIQTGVISELNSSTNSISIWLKASDYSDHHQIEYAGTSFGTLGRAFAFNLARLANVPTTNCIDANIPGLKNLNGELTQNSWCHLVFISEGTIGKFYLNGSYLGQTAIGSPICQNALTLVLGRGTNGSGPRWYNGQLDDIAIYNRALTQQEITNLYSGSTPPTITTSAAPTLINCGGSTTLTASSTSAAQPCLKADLPATLQNGLVGYWPFCGNANDISDNANHGTIYGATLTSDRFGIANSAYEYSQGNWFERSLDMNPAFTVSLWANILNFQNTYQCLFQHKSICSGGGGNNLGTQNTKLRFYNYSCGVCCQGTFLNHDNITTLNTNSWNHYVVSSDGISKIRIYLNNVQIDSIVGQEATVDYGIQPFLLAKYIDGTDLYYSNIKIDDVGYWNRTLSKNEIQQLYSLNNVNYSWSPGNATSPSITVSPTQTTTYTCTASNTAGSTTSSVTVTVADTLTWLGQFDTDWHKPCNWSPQFVPQCCNNVVVPFKSNQPIVSGVAAAEDVTIFTSSGALVSVNSGANLQVGQCSITTTQTVCPSLAVITTTAVSSITQTTAISGGTISYQGASAISARGICWSTSANPTLANSFTTNGTGVGTFTANLTGLIAGTTYYVRAFATNTSGTSYGNEVSFSSQTLAAQYPAGSVFCAGPTAIVDVTNPTTGKTWMDRNLGASQAATSATDAAAYGDLYQWGRGTDGHQCRTSTTITTLSSSDQPGHGNFIIVTTAPNDWRSPQNSNLWQGVNGVNNPCPTGYRLPTEFELNEESLTWSTNNSMGAFSSVLKLTLGGLHDHSVGLIFVDGVNGYYWTSSINGSNSRSRNIENLNAYWYSTLRGYALSVRCIKN